jgi:hypothetical protein
VNKDFNIDDKENERPVWASIENYAFVYDDHDRDEVIFELERLEGSIFIEVDSFEEKLILLTIDILKIMSDKEFARNCQSYSIRRIQGEIDYDYLNGMS